MPLPGKAILAVWNEVDPEFEDDFNDWYLREHIIERTSVPGLFRGRRYRADAGSPRYMAFYEAETMDVLTQGAYRDQLANPTEWTRRILPRFRFAQRGLCDVAVSLGDGIGGGVAVVHVTPGDAPEDAPRLRAWIADILLPELVALPNVTAAHLWILAPGEPASPTSALSRKAEPEHPLAWIIVAETIDAAGAEAVSAAILVRNPLAHGASDVRAYPGYRLLYALDQREA
jgi:hypothetical protein